MLTDEIKTYNKKQLEELAEKLRGQLVQSVKENGGHLSSNLGTVELILALHKVFSFPQDKLIFDVGHQAYVHKLLTGRSLENLRAQGGVSGFPDPFESEYDPFIAGHSGNSVAAGIGLCNARDLRGESYRVVSFIGDASLGNGLALEAVFSSEEKPKNFLVVLNDNGMSIRTNHSALYRSISKVTAKKRYRRFNSRMERTDFFERCGFKYVGPVDGHDLSELLGVLNNIKQIDEPVLLHVITQKGRGYEAAEQDPARFHGVARGFAGGENSFSVALGRLLCSRAAADPSLVAVTAAMTDGVGLSDFAANFPQRLFDVGICEEYAVTMAAGMARGGLFPVVCLYSTFLQRAADQIIHDVCLQNLPVLFCVDRAGFVGSDGKTHQGLLDLPMLRAVPNLDIYAPKDCAELADVFDFARSRMRPALLRYPNGYCPNLGSVHKISDFYLWETLSDGDGPVVLACGARAVSRALEAKKLSGVKSAKIVNCRTVSPLDERFLDAIDKKKIITFEEGYAAGGFGSAVAEYYARQARTVQLKIMGADSVPVEHATAAQQAEKWKLTAADLARKIQAWEN